MPCRLRRMLLCFALILLFTACSDPGGNIGNVTAARTPTPHSTPSPRALQTPIARIDTCPRISFADSKTTCYTPHQLRIAYGVESLTEQGFTGKGQTVIDIVSFGSPTLQHDLDIFDKQFGLPPITVQVIAPLGMKSFDPKDNDMLGWASETELDVQMIHAIAPEAGIVVLTSPVSETEGTIGLPEFRQLEQYVLAHHLGMIVSQSWGASELTLQDQAGQQELQKWDVFYQKATTQLGMTYFSSSGDNGATDFIDLQAKRLAQVATTIFPADEPWVTSVGGTTLTRHSGQFSESVWNNRDNLGGASGGGFSRFYSTPAYQRTLPTSVQNELANRRGVPDVAAVADPSTEMATYVNNQWNLIGGTSASAPLWAGIMAVANQVAGRPLGFINPALYKLAQTSSYTQDFHDITTGDNTNATAHVQGYVAAPGWDPATGLGSPDAARLIPDLVAAMK